MYKIVVNNEVVDLATDDLFYVFVNANSSYSFCHKEQANAVMGVFSNIYQIPTKSKNVVSEKYPMCDLLTIDEYEYNELFDKLNSNILVIDDNTTTKTQHSKSGPEVVNLLNKINELESKLNKLLNAE